MTPEIGPVAVHFANTVDFDIYVATAILAFFAGCAFTTHVRRSR